MPHCEGSQGPSQGSRDNGALETDINHPAALGDGLTECSQRERSPEPHRGLGEECELRAGHEVLSRDSYPARALRARSSASTARMTRASTTLAQAAGIPASLCIEAAPA